MKKKTTKIKSFFERIKISKGAGWLSGVLVVLSFVGLVVCSYYINEFTITASQSPENNDLELYKFVSILKDILIVVFSTFGVNLLISFCIERKNQNKAFEEFFTEEIISSPKFYQHLPEKDRQTMLNAMELSEYYNESTMRKRICDNTREKIISNTNDYYYSDCSYNVTVDDKGDYFEKTVVYSISIKPYEQKTTIKDFVLASVTNKKINGLDIVEVKSIQYNGNDITKKCIPLDKSIDENFGEKKDFDNITKIVYKDKFTVTEKRAASFMVTLITRCPKDDITSSFRASVPCERFSVQYKIRSNEYKIKAYAFGVCKKAENSSAKEIPNEATIKFSDWIFTDDGVVVVMCKN